MGPSLELAFGRLRKKARNKRYYEENSEKVKAREKRYREENSEKLKAYDKRYYEENSEKVKARKKRYREENPEKVKARDKRYREENPEKVKAREKRYYEENSEKVKARVQKRRALKRGATVSVAFTNQEIWERDRGICHFCGKKADPKNWHLDHLVPLSKGGAHAPWNVAVSHPRCNLQSGPGRLPAQLLLEDRLAA